MQDLEAVIASFEGTELGRELSEIHGFFQQTQKRLDAFVHDMALTCPYMCGRCCEHFTPDITEGEALLIAAYILGQDNQQEFIDHLKAGHDGYCPLYRPLDPYHCSVYEARPLVCRLFGNSCFPDKNEKPTFGHCHLHPDGPKIEPSVLAKYPDPPVMGQFGIDLESLESNDERELLMTAVLKALDKLQYYSLMLNGPHSEA